MVRIGKGEKKRQIPIPSKPYVDYENKCKFYIPNIEKPIDYPVNIKMVFYRDSIRKIDLVNLEEAVCDILVKFGVLADDNRNIVAGMDESRVFYDKNHPRTEVTITPMKGDYEQWTKQTTKTSSAKTKEQ